MPDLTDSDGIIIIIIIIIINEFHRDASLTKTSGPLVQQHQRILIKLMYSTVFSAAFSLTKIRQISLISLINL